MEIRGKTMRMVEPSVEVLTNIPDNVIQFIEHIGRVCYKSEDRITADSAAVFIRNLLKNGHESVLEHYNVTVRFITDRGVTHEIVRHRLASYSQESTRYCNYGGGITYINMPDFGSPEANKWVERALAFIDKAYCALIRLGVPPQMARFILPNGLKTEIVMTANLREWRHFLKLRTSPKAHPQMRQISLPLLTYFQKKIPVVFSDVLEGYGPEDITWAKLTESKLI